MPRKVHIDQQSVQEEMARSNSVMVKVIIWVKGDWWNEGELIGVMVMAGSGKQWLLQICKRGPEPFLRSLGDVPRVVESFQEGGEL